MIVAAVAHPLVHLNAGLNLSATVLLLAGYVLIQRGRRQAHGRVMLAAFAVSCLFLTSYVCYHAQVGSVRFTHPGVVRYVYMTILFTHIPLAAAVPFLALWTIYFALAGTGVWRANLTDERRAVLLARHRSLAHWTFPIWLYVSISGVVVYAMLYHLWPPGAG
ncbi:MAG: DUF420 domain-containing protein [Pirellulales bacterium]|nr:DUF420 domain-containing protein [Pirellulales bacterium]